MSNDKYHTNLGNLIFPTYVAAFIMRLVSMSRTRHWLAANSYVVYPIICWAVLFTYYEHIDPYMAVSHCSFPQLPILTDSNGNKNSWNDNVGNQISEGALISDLASSSSGFPINKGLKESLSMPQTHVLVIADPQLVDRHTYPTRSPLLLKISQHTVDNYIYKNYRALLKNLQPHIIIFLGDLLDDGRTPPSEDYYETQYKRFENLFVKPTKEHQGKRNKNNIEIITNVAGNHDIGFGNGVTSEAIDRFESHFGPRNLIIEKPSQELILLNDLLLTASKDGKGDNDIESYLNEDRTFISNIGAETKSKTRILLDHVPLWRDTSVQHCGAKRESKNPFPVTRGHQYQTLVTKEDSDFILKSIKPDIILSGDDHDYCEVVHNYKDDSGVSRAAIGINVKSISMAMGIRQPAVHLLTLYDEPVKIDYDWIIKGQKLKERGEEMDFAYSMCVLSKPYLDVAMYICGAISTLIWNLTCCSRREKHIVSITELRVYESSVQAMFRRLDWAKFFQFCAIQSGVTLVLYLIFTGR